MQEIPVCSSGAVATETSEIKIKSAESVHFSSSLVFRPDEQDGGSLQASAGERTTAVPAARIEDRRMAVGPVAYGVRRAV